VASQRHVKRIVLPNRNLTIPELPVVPLDAQHESDSKGTKTLVLVACQPTVTQSTDCIVSALGSQVECESQVEAAFAKAPYPQEVLHG
jgi:hypothetical protein